MSPHGRPALNGITPTRDWILAHARDKRVVMLDDDVKRAGWVRLEKQKFHLPSSSERSGMAHGDGPPFRFDRTTQVPALGSGDTERAARHLSLETAPRPVLRYRLMYGDRERGPHQIDQTFQSPRDFRAN